MTVSCSRHDALEFVTTIRIDIELTLNVADSRNQIFRGVISINAGQSRIDAEVAALRRRLKDAFDRIFKNAAIFVFGRTQGLDSLLACGKSIL